MKKYQSCRLSPLVYLGPLVHLAEGMPRIIGSSPLVPLRSEYYLEYVTTRVFGEAKNTNFLKNFLQYVKHVDARSNKEQFINKLLHTYSVACRSLSEFLIWFRVLCWRAQVRSESFWLLLKSLMNPSLSLSIHLFSFEPLDLISIVNQLSLSNQCTWVVNPWHGP